MSNTTLSVGEFADLLDRLGADLTHWPAPQRQAADALLSHSPAAAAMLADALALGECLKAAQPTAPAGLVDRIIAAAGADKPKN